MLISSPCVRPVRKLVAIAREACSRTTSSMHSACTFQLYGFSDCVAVGYQGETCYQIRLESVSPQCKVWFRIGNSGGAALTDYLLKGGRMRRLPATHGGSREGRTIDEARRGGRPQDLRFANDGDDERGFPKSLPATVGCCIGS